MHVEIEKIVRQGGLVEITTPVGPLEWERGTELAASPVTLKGRLSRVRRGYEFDATLEGALTLECVRCLESFAFPLSFGFHLLLITSEDQPHGETQIQEGDCDLYLCPNGKVDLAAVAREQIYLQIPLKPVCTEACRGLCLSCGESLNRGPCRCSEPANERVG